ncbi:hexamerin 70b-like [Arctopsyche grandis]|uniref:hexamerin 70b-like n=1 Tax=Arctopsyche grandis TaxID=121162 RepID=UPI00406D9CE5
MRGLAVFLFFILAVASANLVEPKTNKVADKEFLLKQKHVYQLFYHVHQQNIHKEQVQIGREYNIESNMDKYTDTQAVKNFLHRYGEGMVPKGRIFAVMYRTMLHDAEALCELFYHAKDWETFYNTACWAREFMNEQLFVYALSVAIIHRPDCYGLLLPPSYEILPHYYFSNEVMQKAYYAKMQGHIDNLGNDVHFGADKSVIINSNYTGWYINFNEEQKLSYFTEDIGLNYFYYFKHMEYPAWMNGKEYGLTYDRRGEHYYYLHQQILARYYLERLSNGMGEIPTFSWMWPVETGFYPSMKYFNGLEYPIRPNHFDLKKDEFLTHLIEVEDYERRIRDAIDRGFIIKEDGTHLSLHEPESIEYLANIIEGNPESANMRLYRYSNVIARMLLGNSVRPATKHAVGPSALENYQTSMRDPMFYQLYKRYVGFFNQYKKLLTPYTKEELSCPGVKIENVEVEKLITYFDHFDTEITNAVWQTKDEFAKMDDQMEIKVRQSRLNHKPYTVTVNTVSEKDMKVVVRMYVGPKFDGKGQIFNLNKNRLNFFQLEQFTYDMKAGKNVIKRNSDDNFDWFSFDSTPSRETYNKVTEALGEGKEYHVDESEPNFGFPERLALPKGRKGGMPFYLYVIVSPFHAPHIPEGKDIMNEKVGTGTRFVDSLPMGYPFDREIYSESTFMSMHNMHFEDIVIFHKKESEINQVAHN